MSEFLRTLNDRLDAEYEDYLATEHDTIANDYDDLGFDPYDPWTPLA